MERGKLSRVRAGRIDTAAIESRLTGPLAGPVVWFDEIGSTNDEIASRARLGDAEGLIVGADHQTAGRGRRGRAWRDDPGRSVAVSVLVRPPIRPTDAGLLPLVAAVAVADALTVCGCANPMIGWPNDIFVAGRKVAGILCELSSDKDDVHWGVVGIGVNVGGVPDIPDARWTPGAVGDALPDTTRPDVLVAVLVALSRRYDEWCRAGATAIVAEFSRRDALAGRQIALQIGDNERLGRSVGIDGEGRLRFVSDAGEEQLAAGEVTRVIADAPA
ncbi:MAG: biotin--[acetyl-CoA-carboxylase] ligase [Actinobacteria bacterium]|nr:biotin--[acetyl-CoA-carboxylase] ligase [Actinomycetota bacterium]